MVEANCETCQEVAELRDKSLGPETCEVTIMAQSEWENWEADRPLWRNRLILLLILLAAIVCGALYYRRVARPFTRDSAQVRWSRPEAHLVLKIDGMDCVMCAAGLQNTLRALPGVRRAEVSFQDKQAVLDYDPAAVGASRFEMVIADSGFKVVPPTPASP